MAFHVPNKVQSLWDEWNLRSAILFSLFLQVLMTLSAPSRKITKNKMITSVLWSAYLLADWVAAFVIGLIVSVQGNNGDKSVVNKELAAFWAPFLLLHLGGPDTITAFSPEDNELWLRHLAGLLFQVGAVAYVFAQSAHNEFWIPTVLVIFAGTIKYAERTRALYLARSGNYGSSGQYIFRIPKDKNNTDFWVVEKGKMLFKYYRVLILHSMSSIILCGDESFLPDQTSKDAFRIMEVELNFMYDTLYTKMVAVHNKMGYIFRFICFILTVISFQQFAASHHHNKFNLIHGGKTDIAITYTLLIGALGLDLVSFLMLIFSDWTLVSLKNSVTKSVLWAIRRRLPIFHKRWRQSISQFSLISYSLVERSSWIDKVTDFIGLKDFLDEMQYTKTIPIKDDLKDLIFEGMREMHRGAQKIAFMDPATSQGNWLNPLRDFFLAKGNWIVSEFPYCEYLDGLPFVEWSVSKEVDYDRSLLMWHVATEVCYFAELDYEDPNREYSKMLSEYMLYLFVMRPALVKSALAGDAQDKFKYTSDHVKKFMQQQLEANPTKFNTIEEKNKFVCDSILKSSVLTPTSILKDVRDLARSLLKMDKTLRWEMVSKVWVEMLRFGAIHCTARSHAEVLTKGGELLTLVSLLNAHFCLGEQFLQYEPKDKRPSLDDINEEAGALDPSQPNIV